MSKTLKVLLPILAIVLIGPILFSYLKPYGVNGGGSQATKDVFNLAIQKNDISICDKVHLKDFGDVTDQEIQSDCYRTYAAAHPKENVCQRLIENSPSRDTVDGNTIYSDFTLCIDEEAKALSDPKICQQIDDKDYQILCVADVAVKQKDVNICNSLPNKADQQKCIVHFSN